MRKVLFSTIIISVLSGCLPAQKPIEWSAIGGSRSDATVKLAYNYKYGTPNPDINQAIHLAKSRCASWGYASAEVFGGESKVCNGPTELFLGDVMCKGEWTVTKEFQCTGQGNLSQVSEPAATPAPVAAPTTSASASTSEQLPKKKSKKSK